MNARILYLDRIFSSNDTLKIPYFQRRYIWEEEQLSRFADDMESIVNGGQYFLGSMIFKASSDNNRVNNVVDGQQRLTTIFIYMKLLHCLTGEDARFRNDYFNRALNIPVLRQNQEDYRAFDKIMNLDTLKFLSPNDKDDKVTVAYNYFYGRLREKNYEELVNLLNQISNAWIVLIELDYTENEQRIFDTINSLGVDLRPDELLKNYLFIGENDRDRFYESWHPVFDKFNEYWKGSLVGERVDQEKKENQTIYKFLSAFVHVKMWDFQLNEYQRNAFVKQSNIYEACKDFVEKFNMSKEDLANEIVEYAKLYKENFNKEILSKRIPEHFGIERLRFIVMASKNLSYIPYILYVLKNVTDLTEQRLIFGYLERYIIRRKCVNAESKSESELFSESLINNQILTYENLVNYISGRQNSKLEMPSDNWVLSNITSKSHDEKSSKLILYLLESKLAQDNVPDLQPYNDYISSQLMPTKVKAGDDWEFYQEDEEKEKLRQETTKEIGNYFLIHKDGSKESKAKTKNNPKEKISTFVKWCRNLVTTKRDLSANEVKITEWNSKDIQDRNKKIAERINYIWNIQ